MTISDAEEYIDEFWNQKTVRTREDDFKYVECMHFLIDRTEDAGLYYELGKYYDEKRYFSLAEKYYQLALSGGETMSYAALGALYHKRSDFKSEYESYKKGLKYDEWCKFNLALMYRDGDYVEKDFKKYKKMILELLSEIGADDGDPYNEIYGSICWELGDIYNKEHDIKKSIKYYKDAKNKFVSTCEVIDISRIFSILDSLIKEYRAVNPAKKGDFDLFDIYSLEGKEGIVSFTFLHKKYEIKLSNVKGEPCLEYRDKKYRGTTNLITKGKIGRFTLRENYMSLYDFDFVEGDKK